MRRDMNPTTLSLPMYLVGSSEAAYGRLGAILAQGVGELIDRGVAYSNAELGGDNTLMLSQVCGFPFQHRWRKDWKLVATPTFAQLADAPPGHYRSVLIAQKEDERELGELRKDVIAINEPMSQSGHHALLQHCATRGWPFEAPKKVIRTGSHRSSLLAVADGDASLASLDAITFRMLEQAEPALVGRVRVVAKTEPAPGLPIVVRAEYAHLRPQILELLNRLLDDPEATAVGWTGWCADLDYAELTRRRDAARACGWRSLIAP